MAQATHPIKHITVTQHTITSKHLKREVRIDLYVPSQTENQSLSLLLINDGQDLPKMPFDAMLNTLISTKEIAPVFCVGIYCGDDRMNEYGVASQTDYKGRGAKATAYTAFVIKELIPFIKATNPSYSFYEMAYAGFSMGGLSAVDIVWHHPKLFSKVGIFSGSLWWRSKDYNDGYDENKHRIMHQQIREGQYQKGLKFFIQCGALDETADRNNNGIIDSIDDAMDLIRELKLKGYTDEEITYLELQDGKHDVPSWAKAFPSFLKWGWGK